MNFVDVVVLLYAILTIVMGVLGYVSPSSGHPSMPSLIAGVACGGALLGSLALAKSNPRAGRIGAAVVSLLLVGKFAGSFFSKGQIYPAGIMFFASLFALAVLIGGHILAVRNRKAGAVLEGAEK